MNLIILGAGGYGRTVADMAAQSGRYTKINFLDDHSTDVQVLGPCAAYVAHLSSDAEFYPAFGNNHVRLQWLDKLETAGAQITTLIHGTAYVSPKVVIEPGTVVLPHAVINTDTAIRRGCIINCGAMIDHGCVLEEGVHVCLGAIVKAENSIPTGLKVEAGTVIENRVYPLK